MGILLFQLIVIDVFADEVVNIFQLFLIFHTGSRTGQFFYPGRHGLLMLLNFLLVENVFRYHFHTAGVVIVFVLDAG